MAAPGARQGPLTWRALTAFMVTPLVRLLVARYSVPAGRPWRTVCPRCGVAFGWRTGQDCGVLGPRGRCGICACRYGAAPYLLEAAVAAVVIGLVASGVGGWTLAAYLWLAACWLPLSIVDATVHRLPNVLTAAAFGGFLLLLAPAGDWAGLLRAVGGGLLLAAALLVTTLVSPSGMGLGDAKGALSLGAATVWFGWAYLSVAVIVSFGLYFLWALTLMATRRASWRSRLAFGPFLALGPVVVLLLQ